MIEERYKEKVGKEVEGSKESGRGEKKETLLGEKESNRELELE